VRSSHHAVRERENGRGEDEVQGNEQEGLFVADLDGDPERRDCEKRDRSCRRVTDQGHSSEDGGDRPDSDEGETCGLREEQLEVVVPDERAAQARGGEPEEGEAGKRKRSAAREKDEHRSERSQKRGDLGGIRVLHRARTLRV